MSLTKNPYVCSVVFATLMLLVVAAPIQTNPNSQWNLTPAQAHAQVGSAISSCLSIPTTLGLTAAPCYNAVTNAVTGNAPQVDCSTWWYTISTPTCWARGFATILGTGIIWLASWILEWSGLLFNFVVTETVLQFGTLVSSGVITAINIAWSVFRDISNIVII